MIHVRQVRAQGDVVLEYSGSLDVRGAEEIAFIALQQPLALNLVIDISRASNIHDSALGRLVDSLPRSRPHSVRGAGWHHARLLTYLGEKIDEEASLKRAEE